MTAEFFTPALRSKLARALGSNQYITHNDLGALWIEFAPKIEEPSVSKPKKALEMVKAITAKFDADHQFVKLVNTVYYEDPYGAERRNEGQEFDDLEKELERLGFILSDQSVALPATANSSPPEKPAQNWVASWRDTKANDSESSTPEWMKPWPRVNNINEISEERMQKLNLDPRRVFIVHGRDLDSKNTLERFLKHVDALPLTWTDARQLTNKPSPSTLEIVKAGLMNAQAVVVLFTPDDQARLDKQFVKPSDRSPEKELTGQARQNVILEAGMALAMDDQRTILVRKGFTRPISDIEGVHWIDLKDNWDDRQILLNALEAANVAVRRNVNIMDESIGSFENHVPKTSTV
ncbi:nucleotide-binding protein [Glutamicibacter bergerei]|uniref:Nucleotide-binding protein n=2 Tax=Glutamicibacter TaxID=1742989 RepID=A0ABV9MNT2_9MICC|nr:nucleotide-binding protein [Glutamicibacter sp. BW80]PCC28363.1 hypothetical protein CIK76_12070 [Glutamicibacter sp. BW80]